LSQRRQGQDERDRQRGGDQTRGSGGTHSAVVSSSLGGSPADAARTEASRSGFAPKQRVRQVRLAWPTGHEIRREAGPALFASREPDATVLREWVCSLIGGGRPIA
jgi:hypothetical protein